ncbi:MAG: outer membrane protein OmpA-like peptidoglycan-associated protein [Dokdonia sp.]|jgi:outer membrane protein OmpA-like peptidoglycan-associated protein
MGFCQIVSESSDKFDMLAYEDNQKIDRSPIGNNGFKFETFQTGINSKFADYGIGFYREKFLSFSARKVGALSKKDPITNAPYTKLYCSEISYEYDLNRPNLFSHILNKNDNLGTLSFSEDGMKLFFTKSKDEDSQIFQLYSADMNPAREGEFINMTPVAFNNEDYSFENPHLSRDGKTLFFASNIPEAIGGFDIFKVALLEDGTYGAIERIEGSVNTVLDEKFPQTSLDGKYLYYSSKGHQTIGGFDVFRSRKGQFGYVATRNLGNTINTPQDEIAYIPATKTVGYISSDREGGKGSYDIYKLTEYITDQSVSGIVKDFETGIPLDKATVVLLDAEGAEIATVQTNTNGSYTFPVDSFLDYTLLSYKDGFERGATSFSTNTNLTEVFNTEVTLTAVAAEIVETEKKSYINIKNIQFDFNSATIKPISTITLNTVFKTLQQHPEIKVAINAHTDQKGSAPYNLKLSDKRAASALVYLTSKGIAANRLISKGYGETQPLFDCKKCSNEKNEANRRIEFVITSEEK